MNELFRVFMQERARAAGVMNPTAADLDLWDKPKEVREQLLVEFQGTAHEFLDPERIADSLP